MASIQAHLITLFLKWRVKRGLGKTADFKVARAILGRPPPFDARGVTIRPATLGGVPGEWIEPAGGGSGPVLLFLHGGGYFACSPRTHRPLTTAFARAGLRVYAPDYRLAPEHPFPAAVDDAVAVYQALLESLGPGGRVGVAGDSAGGGLSASLLVALKERGAALPAAVALFSPWVDLAGDGASMKTNARRDAMFSGDGMAEVAGLYLNGVDARDPRVSAVFADWAGMPPLLIHVGTWEVLLDDSVRLAERARAAGVDVTWRAWPVVPHAFQLFNKVLPEGRESIRLTADFLRARTV